MQTRHIIADLAIDPRRLHLAVCCLLDSDEFDPSEPRTLGIIASTVAHNTLEAEAIAVRLMAFSGVRTQPQWRIWDKIMRAMTPPERTRFDLLLAVAIATEPLDAHGRFEDSGFFDHLLGCTIETKASAFAPYAVWQVHGQ